MSFTKTYAMGPFDLSLKEIWIMCGICDFELCYNYHSLTRNPEKDVTWESIMDTIRKIIDLRREEVEDLPESKRFAGDELNNLIMNVLGTYQSLFIYNNEQVADTLFEKNGCGLTPERLCVAKFLLINKIYEYTNFIKHFRERSGIDKVPISEYKKYGVTIKHTLRTRPSTIDACHINISCSSVISYNKERFEQDIERAIEETKTLKIEKAKQENKGKGKKQQQSNSTKQANKERDRKKKEREEFYKRSGMACAKK